MNRSEQNDNLSVCNGLTRKESVDINVVDENWMTQTLVETDASDLNEVEHQTESNQGTIQDNPAQQKAIRLKPRRTRIASKKDQQLNVFRKGKRRAKATGNEQPSSAVQQKGKTGMTEYQERAYQGTSAGTPGSRKQWISPCQCHRFPSCGNHCT